MENEKTEKNLFELEGTVSQDAAGIVRLMILVRVDKMLLNWERYQQAQPNSGEQEKHRIRTKSSINVLLAMLKARIDKREKQGYYYKEIKDLIDGKEYEQAIHIILRYLEQDLRLTKIDNTRDYDRTNAELENAEKGL